MVDSVLEPSLIGSDARLIILRHVLEHVEQPVAFMEMLRSCIPDVPVFVEVPDLDWVVSSNAFWDFCYEHCNYFTPASLRACLGVAGFQVEEQRRSFDDQYQWAICRPAGKSAHFSHADAAVERIGRYAQQESARISDLSEKARASGGVAVWGMATKGVVLCSILGGEWIIGGIDANPRKQGCYAPGSGVRINPPEWAASLPEGSAVLVMNPRYMEEIADTVRALDARVRLISV
jgi:hypothetical protein